jgi:hypothetical protein
MITLESRYNKLQLALPYMNKKICRYELMSGFVLKEICLGCNVACDILLRVRCADDTDGDASVVCVLNDIAF